jgi:hypothetical protein
MGFCLPRPRQFSEVTSSVLEYFTRFWVRSILICTPYEFCSQGEVAEFIPFTTVSFFVILMRKQEAPVGKAAGRGGDELMIISLQLCW